MKNEIVPISEASIQITAKEAFGDHHNSRIEEQCLSPYIIKHLDVLSEQTGINLEFIEAEKFEDEFRADIICRDVETDEIVIIENMLGNTDHNHIGKLLAYAGVETENGDKPVRKLITICETARPAHVAAYRLLNKHGFEAYVFEIQFYKFKHDDRVYTQFKQVVCPEITEQTASSPKSSKSRTDDRFAAFFEKFIDILKEDIPSMRCWAGNYQQMFNHQGMSSGIKRMKDDSFIIELVYDAKKDTTGGKTRGRFDKTNAEIQAKYGDKLTQGTAKRDDIIRIEYRVPFNEKDIPTYAEICKAIYTAYKNSDMQ